MKRIWHPYTAWEEYSAGMWRGVSKYEADTLLQNAIEFTGDADLYGEHMMRVIQEWPISCEHNLTDTSTNRKAWLGHAACTLAINCPEHITRRAWGFLSQEQQDAANAKAAAAIKAWERAHKNS